MSDIVNKIYLRQFLDYVSDNADKLLAKKIHIDDGDEYDSFIGYSYDFEIAGKKYSVGSGITIEYREDWAEADSWESSYCCDGDGNKVDINELYQIITKHLEDKK